MDEYTEKTKIWLDKRYKNCDEEGIYYAHQPIYGFRKGHCDSGSIRKYVIAYQIMRAFSYLKFHSLVDVGAAEGYKAYLAKQLFGVKVKTSDLSEEACKRAEEIFNIESIPADIHDLPFKNNEFDVVLCSQTLEHVADVHTSIAELLRVASKAVVITVPHESKEVIDENIKKEIPHAHIHSFDLESLNFLKSAGYHVLSRRMNSLVLRMPKALIDATPIEHCERTRCHIYNAAVAILRKILGKRAAAFLVRLDGFVCKFASPYDGILFIALKDNRCWTKGKKQNISVYPILNFAVPYHYLSKKND